MNIIKLLPASGMVLTTWTEDKPIAEFSYTDEVICDETANIDEWHPMPIEEAEQKAENAKLAVEVYMINAKVIELGKVSGATEETISGSTAE